MSDTKKPIVPRPSRVVLKPRVTKGVQAWLNVPDDIADDNGNYTSITVPITRQQRYQLDVLVNRIREGHKPNMRYETLVRAGLHYILEAYGLDDLSMPTAQRKPTARELKFEDALQRRIQSLPDVSYLTKGHTLYVVTSYTSVPLEYRKLIMGYARAHYGGRARDKSGVSALMRDALGMLYDRLMLPGFVPERSYLPQVRDLSLYTGLTITHLLRVALHLFMVDRKLIIADA